MTQGLRAACLAALLFCAGAWAQGTHPGNAVLIIGFEISNQLFDAFYQDYRRSQGIIVAARCVLLQLL